MREIGFKALTNTLASTALPGQKYWNCNPCNLHGLHRTALALAFHEVSVFTHNKRKAILEPFIMLLTTPETLSVSCSTTAGSCTSFSGNIFPYCDLGSIFANHARRHSSRSTSRCRTWTVLWYMNYCFSIVISV